MNEQAEIARIQKILSTIEYKPGYRMQATGKFYEDELSIYICHWLPTFGDRDDPTKKKELISTTSISNAAGISQERLIPFVFNLIKDLEVHETAEWFKVNGERIYDPHKGSLI